MQTMREATLLEPKENEAGLPHNIIVEERSRLTATGVTKIVRYDENGAVLETRQGTLTIGGSGIQVSELSIKTGEVKISGKIEFIQYTQPVLHGQGGFLRRLAR